MQNHKDYPTLKIVTNINIVELVIFNYVGQRRPLSRRNICYTKYQIIHIRHQTELQ